MADRRQPADLHNDDDLIPWQRDLVERLQPLRDLPPPPSFAPIATQQFLDRLAAAAPPPVQARSRRRRTTAYPLHPMGLRLAAVMLVMLIALLGTGYATAASLPGDTFYPVKRQAEEVRVHLASPDTRDELRQEMLDTRLAEIDTLVRHTASPEQIAAGVSEYEVAVAVAVSSDDQDRLQVQLQNHSTRLAALEAGASPTVALLLQTAQQAATAPLTPGTPSAPTSVPPVPTATPMPTSTLLPRTATPEPQPSRPTTEPARTRPEAPGQPAQPAPPGQGEPPGQSKGS